MGNNLTCKIDSGFLHCTQAEMQECCKNKDKEIRVKNELKLNEKMVCFIFC